MLCANQEQYEERSWNAYNGFLEILFLNLAKKISVKYFFLFIITCLLDILGKLLSYNPRSFQIFRQNYSRLNILKNLKIFCK